MLNRLWCSHQNMMEKSFSGRDTRNSSINIYMCTTGNMIGCWYYDYVLFFSADAHKIWTHQILSACPGFEPGTSESELRGQAALTARPKRPKTAIYWRKENWAIKLGWKWVSESVAEIRKNQDRAANFEPLANGKNVLQTATAICIVPCCRAEVYQRRQNDMLYAIPAWWSTISQNQ